MLDPIIMVNNVTKIYPNGVVANKDVSIEVNTGEVVCIVGPNGAGKTTLIRQIMGLLKPTKGEIKVFGMDPIKNQVVVKREIGYVPQLPLMFPAHKIIEVLEYVASLSKISMENVIDLLDKLGLINAKDLLGYQLSLGLRKLLLISIALIKNPRALILDEPTSFMDIVRKKVVWDLISEFRGRDKSVLLVSHDLEEVKRLCDRFYLMLDGRVIFHAKSIPSIGGAELRIHPGNTNNGELMKILRNGIIKGGYNELVVSYDSLIKAINDLQYLASNGIDGVRLMLEYPSLESFLEVMIKENRSKVGS